MPSKYNLDKFYTKNEVVSICLSTLDLSIFSNVIEPSAGNGSFSNRIKNCIALDIEPENETIKKQDFFDFTIEEKNNLIIGNPPFGRQNNLAINFFNKASEIGNVIAFILPKSFKKESIQNKLNFYFHKIIEIDLPNNSFYYKDEEVNVPCVWQVWEKRDYKREAFKKETTDDFLFVKKEEANCSVRRVGVNAGKAFDDLQKSKQSHYFIMAKNKDNFIKKINSITWEHNNTVGPRSISKNELIKAYNSIDKDR